MILSHLKKRYGDEIVLDDVTLTLPEGRLSALVGPSGSGKTTLLRILAGLEKPEAGDLSPLEGKRISMVFQENRLCPNLSAWANVKLVTDKYTARHLLEELGLSDSLSKPCREFSGGMQRRVALARALAAPYDLLLLDEPFTGLDPDTKKRVIEVTRHSIRGKTTLIVTHDPIEAELMGATSSITLPSRPSAGTPSPV